MGKRSRGLSRIPALHQVEPGQTLHVASALDERPPPVLDAPSSGLTTVVSDKDTTMATSPFSGVTPFAKPSPQQKFDLAADPDRSPLQT